MPSRTTLKLSLLAGVLLAAACAPAATPGSGGSAQAEPPRAPQTLRMVIRAEPASVAGTVFVATGITTGTQRRLFNAGMALKDANSQYRPYLAETLPQLNTGTWKVTPDGKMETTFRLRPNLTWHDGHALTAADFAFASKVYATPDFGLSKSVPHVYIDEVAATDDRTVVIHWNQPYPDAAQLDTGGLIGLTPLPAHVLQSPYDQQKESFTTHPYWSTEFVGAGPYRIERWEPGAFIDAVAFGGHSLGQPKIDRLHITWNSDFNATLSVLLAGEADIPGDDSIRVEQGLVLEQEWTARNAGTVQYRPQLPRFVQVQHRADFAKPADVRDVRVRRALAHAIDKNTTNETLFQGKAVTTDTLIFPTVSYYSLVDQAATKYPFDLRAAEQLLTSAGYSREADGVFAGPNGRLDLEVRNIQSAQNDAERSIIADTWRKAGFQISEDAFAPSQNSDGQALGTFRSLSITSAQASFQGVNLTEFSKQSISRAETRWTGQNRGGWSNDAYDQAVTAWSTTLDPDERHRLVAQAMKAFTDDLGALPLEFNPGVIAYASAVHGISLVTPDSELTWNIYEWDIR
ncbi:MAG TPA: ABC transporter substrate-binding protein [Chloroflexota bacterium]